MPFPRPTLYNPRQTLSSTGRVDYSDSLVRERTALDVPKASRTASTHDAPFMIHYTSVPEFVVVTTRAAELLTAEGRLLPCGLRHSSMTNVGEEIRRGVGHRRRGDCKTCKVRKPASQKSCPYFVAKWLESSGLRGDKEPPRKTEVDYPFPSAPDRI